MTTATYYIESLRNPDVPTFWTISVNGDWIEYGPAVLMNGIVVSGLQIKPIARELN